MNRVLACVLAALLLCLPMGAAPASKGPRSQETPGKTTQKPYQVGKASWYGKSFHGKLTASGEPYDMFEFTAAHRQLPLGTWVKVTNLRNGKWVIVRVNDRGPFAGENRIIDLSYGAAQMLGLRARGTVKVRLDIIQEPQETLVASDPAVLAGSQ